MKVCPKCNYKVENDEMEFCPECGGELENIAGKVSRVCTSCGEPLPQGIKFCPRCGAKIAESIRNLEEFNPSNLESYDLETLIWVRLETLDDNLEKNLDSYIMKNYTLTGVLQEEENNHNEIVQLYLGICYFLGIGTDAKTEKALYWYKKAAECQCRRDFS